MARLERPQGVLIAVGITDLTQQKESYDRLREYSQRLRALTHHVQNIAEHERKSIARDLHDDMGQVLTALKMELSLLKRGLSESADEERQQGLEEEFISINETNAGFLPAMIR
jgi:signal transduction histidine kinase